MLPVPYVAPVDRPIGTGITVKIGGRCPIFAQRFNVNLQCGPSVNPRDDVAFHLSADFYNQCLVTNNILNYGWGFQQCDFIFPFQRGEDFILEVYCKRSTFEVLVNNYYAVSFEHRLNPAKITHLAIDGDVVLHKVEYIPGLRDSLSSLNMSANRDAAMTTGSVSFNSPARRYSMERRESDQTDTGSCFAASTVPRKSSFSEPADEGKPPKKSKRGWWKCGRSSEDSE